MLVLSALINYTSDASYVNSSHGLNTINSDTVIHTPKCPGIKKLLALEKPNLSDLHAHVQKGQSQVSFVGAR